jgi:hypothetical protein
MLNPPLGSEYRPLQKIASRKAAALQNFCKQ